MRVKGKRQKYKKQFWRVQLDQIQDLKNQGRPQQLQEKGRGWTTLYRGV
tara:strand:+ start:99 stop:245 length:147 start_codon:yes stop_codon:yes gene_type:complete